jgi:HEAT repeat protein
MVEGDSIPSACFHGLLCYIWYTMSDLENLFSDLIGGDDQCAEAAVKEIAEYGSGALPGLHELLSSSDVDERWWAVRTLAVIDDPLVPTLLAGALGDPDEGVRWCAALAFRNHPDPNVVPDLVAMLAEGHPVSARLAGDALVEVGKPAVPALLEALVGAPPSVRIEVVRALALIEDESVIPALFAALDDESAVVEYWADEGLQRQGVGMTFFKP